MERFDRALEKMVNELKRMKNVIGILHTGSHAYGKVQKHSDIDLFALVKGKYRWRCVKYVDGVECELFFNPVEQMMQEVKEKKPQTIMGFVGGKIVYDPYGKLRKIQNTSKQIAKKGMKPGRGECWEQYGVIDSFKDVLDAENEVYFQLAADACFHNIIDAFNIATKGWSAKFKYLLEDVGQKDAKFVGMIRKYLAANTAKRKIGALHIMKEYVLRMYPKLPKEWKTKKSIAPVFKA